MTTTFHDNMHKEHKLWESEISLWRDDIAIWQKDLADTEKDLARVKQAFDHRAEVLRQHAASLRMLEQDVDAHEHALASFEQGDERGQGEALVKFAKLHLNESQLQEKSRETHETLKRHHHGIMSRWNLFLRTFVSDAEQ